MRLRTVLLVLGIAWTLPGAVRGQVISCPPTDAPLFKKESVAIRFGSVVRPSQGRYDFIRCVRSEDPKPVLVDWEGPELVAWVSRSQPAENWISSPKADSRWIQSTAFVGLLRFPTRAGYQRSEEEKKLLEGVKDWISTTIIRIWAPRDSDIPEKTMEQIDATFTSRAVQDGKAYVYRYSWSNKGPAWQFLWTSETIQSRIEDALLTMSETEQSRSFTSEVPPAYSVKAIKVYDKNRRLVASGGVGLYHPADMKH